MLFKSRKRFFPTRRKLLTQDEYQRQAVVFTQKSLEELRQYCRSPGCDKWRLVDFLKNNF
jgi:hypothetical protein